jgi:hypothetical protein
MSVYRIPSIYEWLNNYDRPHFLFTDPLWLVACIQEEDLASNTSQREQCHSLGLHLNARLTMNYASCMTQPMHVPIEQIPSTLTSPYQVTSQCKAIDCYCLFKIMKNSCAQF